MDPIQQTLTEQVNNLLKQYYKLDMPRHPKLFNEFLPMGYEATSLTSIEPSLFDTAQAIKLLLGIFITLSDDFSEHPEYIHSNWVTELIRKTTVFNDERSLDPAVDLQAERALILAIDMFQVLFEALRRYSKYPEFLSVIEFDFQQYYQCLNYSVMISKQPLLACGVEYRHYSPHNMGMIIAGMIDLSLSTRLNKQELPKIRHIFYTAQRLGHICNTLTTLHRELKQGDINNEISLQVLQHYYPENVNNRQFQSTASQLIEGLNDERERHYAQIKKLSLKSFCVEHYLRGLKQLQALHERLEEYL